MEMQGGDFRCVSSLQGDAGAGQVLVGDSGKELAGGSDAVPLRKGLLTPYFSW